MIDAHEQQLLDAVETDSAVRLLQKVLQTNTTCPPGNEIELARYLADYLGAAGITAELITYEDGRANLTARLRGTGGRPALVFSAHMDTVPTGEEPWVYPPFSGTLADGKIYGRGAADMKSGLAAMTEAAVILARSGVSLRGDVIIAFTHDETYGLKGAKRLVEAGKLDGAGAVLVGEPSSLDVFIAEKGALWLRCRTRGKTAHTSMPHLGTNAIFGMVDFLHRVERELDLGGVRDPLLGSATCTVGTIRGGVTINVIPDACEAELDIRLVPGIDYQVVVERVRALGGENLSVEVIDWKPWVVSDLNHEIVALALEAASQVTGEAKRPKGVSYFSDGAIIANRLGIPMVNIGPGDTEMTHQPNEYVSVTNLVQAIRIYLLIAKRYLG